MAAKLEACTINAPPLILSNNPKKLIQLYINKIITCCVLKLSLKCMNSFCSDMRISIGSIHPRFIV